MIVRDKNNLLALLFSWHGTILPSVMPALIVVIGISTVISVISIQHVVNLPQVPAFGFTIFGVILSIFLGFKNSACYERWWEGRKLWGSLIANTRHLDRETLVLNPERRERVLSNVILFTALLRDRLRYQTAHPTEFLEFEHLDATQKQHIHGHLNPPQYTLSLIQKELVDALNKAEISDIVYGIVVQHIIELGNVQAGCDRIASTPLPYSYSVLLNRAVYFFCLILPFSLPSVLGLWTPVLIGLIAYLFLGLDALSSQLEEPFGTQDNDLPLDSMVRLIERELLTALDKDVPPALHAEQHRLL